MDIVPYCFVSLINENLTPLNDKEVGVQLKHPLVELRAS